MRKLSFFIALPVSILLFISNTKTSHAWQVIEKQQIKGLTTTLKVRQNPKINFKEWIQIEFNNTSDQTFHIEHATYSIDCKVYDKKGGKLLKSNRIASRSSNELLDHTLDSPLPIAQLNPGISIASKYPSILGTVFLSVPEKSSVFVEANLQLNVHLRGQDSLIFNWEEIPFSFEWTRPEPVEFNELYQELNNKLANPEYSTLAHYELYSLLAAPEISKGIHAATLLEALQIRSGKADGKHAILYHLNDHFSTDQKVLDYFFEQLKQKDPQVLDELTIISNIWDDRFLEPLIEQYQTATTAVMYKIMNILYAHQSEWINNEGIASILSDILLYKYEDIIYEDPGYLSGGELLNASLLLEMLGKSGNKEVMPIICPFLDDETRILDSGLVIDPNSLELPRAMRVCDNALEAILRLEGHDLIKTYKKAKFNPPYIHGEGEIIISRIRDHLIEDLQKKKRPCGR